MAKRFLRHSATLLGSVSIMDLGGRKTYREFRRQLPRPHRQPAAGRVADQMRSSLTDSRRSGGISTR